MDDTIKYVNEQMIPDRGFPEFKPGDNIEISYLIIEGNKERTQKFRGDVIQINGNGLNKTFTVRKVSNGIGVERIFPFSSPIITDIKLLKQGNVRRAKLYYLRKLIGKKAKIKEKNIMKSE